MMVVVAPEAEVVAFSQAPMTNIPFKGAIIVFRAASGKGGDPGETRTWTWAMYTWAEGEGRSQDEGDEPNWESG